MIISNSNQLHELKKVTSRAESSWKILQLEPAQLGLITTDYLCYFLVLLLLEAQIETFQDFSIKLDIEPLMHLLKISIFSLNSDIIRLTKIMNNLVKDCKIRTFKVIFQCLKLVESFRKKNSVKNIWLGDQLLLMKFFENFDF